jgi:hypothetical protein
MWPFELPIGNLKSIPLFGVLGAYWFGAAVPKTRGERQLCPNPGHSGLTDNVGTKGRFPEARDGL